MTDDTRPDGDGSGSRGSGGRDDRSRSGGDRRGSGPRGSGQRGGGPRGGNQRGGDRRGGGSGGRFGGRDDRRGGRPQQRDRRDDRREAKEKDPAPQLPEQVTSDRELDGEVRRELATLPRSLAEVVGKHLVAAGLLMDEEPERAYEHAAYARRRASRVAAVREAAGVAAYTLGKWQEALSDLRAARRMSGRNAFLAMMADAERGLGRPERALEITRSPEAAELETAERVELRIVAAGARRDMGETAAALVELQVPELKERRARAWAARLFYAYADVLAELGRESEAREYFARASAVDRDGETDADERLAEIEGVELVAVDDGVVWTDAEDPELADEEPEAAPGGDDPRAGGA
ncbi:hypothetical protein [Nocardiopsis coralliicola]